MNLRRLAHLPFPLLLPLLACSSTTAPTVATGAATISGGSIVPVKSAALIQTNILLEAGPGGQTTYVQFFGNPSGAACGALDAATVVLAGSFQTSADPTTLAGKTLTFGSSPDTLLTFAVAASGDAGDGGESDAGITGAPSLVATSGTIAFSSGASPLTGTIDAEMVLASAPGSATVSVKGTFSAPLCSN